MCGASPVSRRLLGVGPASVSWVGMEGIEAADWPTERRAILRDAVGIGLAVGALGVSFGALSVVSGMSIAQTCALSLLMFTGGSQFALIGVVGAGGSPFAGAAAAVLLGARNAFYGLPLSIVLRVRGLRRMVAAQLVIDESSAMSIGRSSDRAARLGFWSTGIAVFVGWNAATLAGAIGARALPDPEVLGLDVAAPAAFAALLAPRMRGARPWVVALGGAAVALFAVPVVPIGVPVLLAALVAVVLGLGVPHRVRAARTEDG